MQPLETAIESSGWSGAFSVKKRMTDTLYEMSPDLVILRDTVRRFAAEAIVPHARQWDREANLPDELIARLGELGLLGILVPEAYGGTGGGSRMFAVAIEEIARAEVATALMLAAHTGLCCSHLVLAADDAQKRRYLPDLASGRTLGSWALTEPSSGSDAAALKTRAVPDGDQWVLNGHKQFITNAKRAGLFVVLARTTDEGGPHGISAFVIPRDTAGLSIGPTEDKMGMRASDTAPLTLEDVRVPSGALVGKLNEGFAVVRRVLNRGRITIGALSVGLARAALEESLSYAQQREQFGKRLSELQAIQFMLADMATETDAARLLVDEAAIEADETGEPGQAAAGIAKLYASEAAVRAGLNAIQILGGYGYLKDHPVERVMRDAKLCEIGEGTSQVQRIVIARKVLDDAGDGYPSVRGESQEHDLLRRTIRDFAAERVEPGALQRDETGEYPRALVAELAQLGGMGICVPEEFGGAGMDAWSSCILIDELSRADASMGVIVSVQNSLVIDPILQHATDEQKHWCLPKLATGEWIGCFSLTEPHTGSDANAIRTRAELRDDGWHITGTKCFVTNGAEADLALLIAVTDPDNPRRRLSAFLVETDSPGFRVGKHEDKLGIRSTSTVELICDDLVVSPERMLGPRGEGIKVALGAITGGRLGVASQALGISEASLRVAARYAQERETFGRPIADYQAIQWKLADTAVDIAASRVMIRRAAWLKQVDRPFASEAAMAKTVASEAASRCANRAIQTLGGYGYIREYKVERYLRDAKITELYEGTSEVQRITVARGLLERS